MIIKSLDFVPISESIKSCIVPAEGVQGSIFYNYCPATLDFDETANIYITCKNTGTAAGFFALLFCASSPSVACDTKNYVSPVFYLAHNETKDFTIPITMPNSQVSYVATIQHASVSPIWMTDNAVPCTIRLTSQPPAAEAGGSSILILGLAVGALAIMMSKKK